MTRNTRDSLAVVAVAGAVAVMGLCSAIAVADIVQPVNLQLREQEPDTYLVQWSAPQTYPVQALPEPVLPDDCQPQGERLLQQQPGTWLNRQVFRCKDPIAGREIGVHYPFVSAGQSAMLRVELLSGEQMVHALNPGEDRWLVPEIDAGLTAHLWRNLRRAVMDGLRHFLVGWLHLAFWAAIAVVREGEGAVGRVGAFTLGQILAVATSVAFGVWMPAVVAEGGLAVAVIVLAGAALRSSDDPRQLLAVCGATGLLHGWGLTALLPMPQSFVETKWLYQLLAVAGMDACLLLLTMAALAAGSRVGKGLWVPRFSRLVSYGLGSFGVAATLLLIFAGVVGEAGAAADRSRLPGIPGSDNGASAPGSRRVAAQGSQAPIQSFLSIEAFEVRHQILVRLRDLARELEIEGMEILAVEVQPEIKERLQDFSVPLAAVEIDGAPAVPIVDRIDFLTVDTQGVLPRNEPVVERLAEAYMGITLVFLTSQTPESVDLIWGVFPEGLTGIPATASDPEFSQTVTLNVEAPRLTWQNNLSVDLVPTVSAIAIEPRVVAIPVAAMLFVAVALVLLGTVFKGAAGATKRAWVRVGFVIALLVAPAGELALALPSGFGSVPSPGGARRILAGVLPNVYRAFEFREESDAYDRLAVSVTGDTLSTIYLEHRRALEMEERGGARARVEAVEVQEIRAVAAGGEGGFETDAVWVVGGTVTHFGHRHFRQNRYDARVSLVPVDDTWKIHRIELYDEERLR